MNFSFPAIRESFFPRQFPAIISTYLSLIVCWFIIITKLYIISFIVASVLISSSKLAIGTYDGEVYVHDSMKLLEGSEPIQYHVATLKAHIRTVYSLVSLKTRISPDGFTSTFPTFLGKAQENYEQELLVSTGYGRGYPELRGESKAFVSFYQQGGCYVNTWLL